MLLKPCSIALFDVAEEMEESIKMKKKEDSDSNIETSSDHSSQEN